MRTGYMGQENMYDQMDDRSSFLYENSTIGTPGSALMGQSLRGEFSVENPIGMNLMLMSQSGEMRNYYLPYPPKGRHVFEASAPVFMEASGMNWNVRSTGRGTLIGADGCAVRSMPLRSQCMISIHGEEDDYMLYAEEVNKDSFAYHNYIVLASEEIRIGRAVCNDIVCPEKMVSRYHAGLLTDGRDWKIWDSSSANGVFVNGQRVSECELHTGDVICIMGLRMILGSGFLSINDGNGRLEINEEKLLKVEDTGGVLSFVLPDPERMRPQMFNRLPRKRLALKESKIEIESPPIAMNGEKIPLLMRMGSSMVMGGTAALTGNVSMLATSVLFPMLSQQYTKEDREAYEKRRLEKYHEYLDDKWQEIQEEKKREESALNSNYPRLAEVLRYAERKEKLWERRKTDDDFLTLRIGSGNIPLMAEKAYAKRRFDLEHDALLDEMYALAEQEVMLEQVPIMQDLKTDPIWGVLGPRETALYFVRSMVMRLSLLYSYDEVKLVFLAEPDEVKGMEFIRYLPHVWDDRRSIRFLATDISETYQIGDHISKSLGEDLEKPQPLADMMKRHPYYIIFALSKRLFDSMEMLKTAMQQEKNCSVSILAVFDDVPKECSLLLNFNQGQEGITSGEHSVVYLRNPDRKESSFVLDTYSHKLAEKSMREIANTSLKLVSQAYALPKTLTFLEMLGVGRMEHLDIAKRWRENNPVKSLAVPIGVGTDGSLFTLDLHQKFQGPHGLVAGTTGSGKSEFLLTYILSLALNFHPDEVAFVLIDYKGGGLAGAFDDPANGIHLPHLIATITNLDGSAIARSLVSIQSEMTRRQRVFNAAKSASGEGTMDIYTYQRLYRNKTVTEPMPHLFIISDEFAELKQQQPEFLDQLVSIARIGRSLGVHLILATQKPSGVVTDQIVSNTKFRVCLKVQDRSDSMDMLKRPEASELRETGRFYLQVGNNELFSLGQSAWSGAEYEPQDEVSAERAASIQVIDSVGAGILEIKPEKKKTGSGKSQLVVIVKTITDLARELGIPQRSLWLPALEKQMDIDRIEEQEENRSSEKQRTDKEEGLSVCCGLLDDPAAQKQHLLRLDLMKCGHILVTGESGNGKTTFIQSLLYSLASKYSPAQFNFYILDYSSRLLNLFGKLPHCGAVLGEEQEGELNAFFKLIMEIVQERKRLFSELEVDSFESACRIQPFPFILVVIDNFAGLNATRTGQKHVERMQTYLKNCGNYGIRFVISISYLNEASMRVKQELTERIVLHMKDKYDFGEALGCRVSYLPPDQSGRGLYCLNGRPLEMQLAMFEPEKKDKERIEDLKQRIEELRQHWETCGRAKQLQILSETETYESFAEAFHTGRFPLGYPLKNGAPVALPLKQFSMLSLYFGNPDSVAPVLDNFLYTANREKMGILFLRRRENSCFEKLKYTAQVHAYDADEQGISMIYQIALAKIKERNERLQKYCEENNLNPKKQDIHLDVFSYMHANVTPILIILERYADLCEASRNTDGLIGIFSSIYLLARRFQIYIVGCFYPDENAVLTGSKIYDCFNKEKLCMLFGGCLSKQKLVSVPYDMGSTERPSAYNRCVMSYQGAFYPMLMPCGEKKKEVLSEDDRPIFEQE
ncbi:MAG: type VII secretion protein EssC [Lachnospiraceae bacterium]|nr:type VII secretion protein EssC [Lachnospiraceae bacterium]